MKSIPDILRLGIAASAVGFAITLFNAGVSPSSTSADLMSTAHVIDGDSIQVAGTEVRLWGIDAPEWTQTCQEKNGETYRYGLDAVVFNKKK